MANRTDGNEPAFATQNFYQSGLSKKEYFAAMAMQSLLTRVPNREGGETDLGILESRRICMESVIMADALIEALNKEK
jgi:hypothetical protein